MLNATFDATAMEDFPSLGEDVEQQLDAAPVEPDVAELVDQCRRRHRSTK